MKKPKLYLETTVISYLTARPASDLNTAAHQQITTEWWESKRKNFDVYISKLVRQEAASGNPEAADRRLKILKPSRQVAINSEVVFLARRFGEARCIPAKATADAAHIALAAVHQMHFLLTWNCTHINNVATVEQIREVCADNGIYMPGYLHSRRTNSNLAMKDSIIQEIRKFREAHAAKFKNNFEAITTDWLKQQATARKAGEKFLDFSAKAKTIRPSKKVRRKTKMAARHGFEP